LIFRNQQDGVHHINAIDLFILHIFMQYLVYLLKNDYHLVDYMLTMVIKGEIQQIYLQNVPKII